MTQIGSSGGNVTCGEEETETAIKLGAAKTLLIQKEMYKQSKYLIEKAESKGVEVEIIEGSSKTHNMFLDGFGGIGSILNFQIE